MLPSGLIVGLKWLVLFVAALLIGGVLIAWSGLYNVAASRGHTAAFRWLLTMGMENSVRTRTRFESFSPPPQTARRNLVTLGAGHFEGVCAPCHGAPGSPASVVFANLLPEPPSLSQKVGNWNERQLAWIVKHGLKYTGMPAWTSQSRDDEIWSVVAFLRELPRLDAESYAALVHGNAKGPIVRDGSLDKPNLTTCTRCHGDAENPPTSALVPRLAGQSKDYLNRALAEFAAGKRRSGIMEPIASVLIQSERAELALYYARLRRPSEKQASNPERSHQKTRLDQGQRLARTGASDRTIPPCLSCHDAGGVADYPRLAGLSATYLRHQLRLWKSGLRAQTPQGEQMAIIAKRLTDDEMQSVAAFFSSRPISTGRNAGR
jgi:cytochrome c553